MPAKFGWSLWIILYLILDKIGIGSFWWITVATLFVAWAILFFYIKSIEKPFSIVSFKENIQKWISE